MTYFQADDPNYIDICLYVAMRKSLPQILIEFHEIASNFSNKFSIATI